MKKVYLKPAIEILEEELTQMLCSSTVINPGEDNRPAGARDSGWDLWDDADDNQSAWDDEEDW
jgi:hypothetical protein